jgi:tetratricopeptide (TPR) repeat protein
MVVESLDAKGKVTVFGSGVVIAPGRVITNRHVIEDGASFRIEHGGKKCSAKLIRVDPGHDLAELSVAGLAAPVVTVLDSSKLAVGETVYAIGAPEGLELTISEGLISGLRDFDNGRVIQTSAAISPGSSGGGLFDAEGRLVGITTFYLKEGQSLNFALPAEWTLALNRPAPGPSLTADRNSPEFQALVWFVAGYKADQAHDYVTAVDAYQETARLVSGPAKALVLVNLGLTYGELGQYNKEVSADQEAIRLKPDDEGAWASLGFAYSGLGQFDKAVGAEEQAVHLKPDDALAWYILGTAYGGLGRYGDAVSAEQQALRLEPDDADAWFKLGGFYSLLRQYDKSVSAYQEALRLKPDDATAWFGLGLAYAALGQQSDVIKVYERLKALDPKQAEDFFKMAVLP